MGEEQKKNEQDRIKAIDVLLERSISITMIMNDVFVGAADAEDFSIDDLPTMVPIICEFGDDALIAYAAVKIGREPFEELRTEKYKKAKQIIEICKKNDKWFLQ